MVGEPTIIVHHYRFKSGMVYNIIALMAKLAYAASLDGVVTRRVGSSPTWGTDRTCSEHYGCIGY